MRADDALINLLDEEGNVVAQRLRSQIDKKKAILKTVYILVVDKAGQVFVTEPKGTVFGNQYGCSAAGIVRQGETVLEAAKRTLEREVGLSVEPVFLGEEFHDFGGIKRFMNVFYLRTDKELKVNENDVGRGFWIAIERVEKESGKFYPTFLASFKLLKEQLKEINV